MKYTFYSKTSFYFKSEIFSKKKNLPQPQFPRKKVLDKKTKIFLHPTSDEFEIRLPQPPTSNFKTHENFVLHKLLLYLIVKLQIILLSKDLKTKVRYPPPTPTPPPND